MMPETISTAAFSKSPCTYLKAARNGETVIVTCRGKPSVQLHLKPEITQVSVDEHIPEDVAQTILKEIGKSPKIKMKKAEPVTEGEKYAELDRHLKEEGILSADFKVYAHAKCIEEKKAES